VLRVDDLGDGTKRRTGPAKVGDEPCYLRASPGLHKLCLLLAGGDDLVDAGGAVVKEVRDPRLLLTRG